MAIVAARRVGTSADILEPGLRVALADVGLGRREVLRELLT